MHIVNRVILAS